MNNQNTTVPAKLSFDWQDVEHDTVTLVKKIKESGALYKGMVVVSRGGLGVAALVSRLLDIKLLDIMCVASYNHANSNKTELQILKNPDLAQKDKGSGWLVVDDLIDSGDTYKYIIKILPQADFACLYNKSNQESFVKNIFFAKNCPRDSWIEFPWETITNN